MSDLESKLAVVTAILADLEVDALVSETDTALRLTTGPSLALRARCGPDFERPAAELGPIALGETVAVEGGRIWARTVILCAVFGPGAPPTEAIVRRCISSALDRAEELHAESLAVPLLGVGPGGVGMEWCANATVEFVAARLRTGFFPHRAVFVAADPSTHASLERAVRRVCDSVP
jgi:O-acetyl-ADP-ribose deacetylase (regulator of RNase III)